MGKYLPASNLIIAAAHPHPLRMRHEDHALGGLGSYRDTGQSPVQPGDHSRGYGMESTGWLESDGVPHGQQPGPYSGPDTLGESHNYRSNGRSHEMGPRRK
jgi:hypothetical protein